MQRNSEQERALKAIDKWLKTSDKQVFRLFGSAGTGKTQLAGRVREMVDGDVICVTPTGKAASVLRKRGWSDATTIHAVAYIPASKSKQYLLSLIEAAHEIEQKLLAEPNDDELLKKLGELKLEMRKEKSNLSKPTFKKNLLSPLYQASLCVLDEGSMVDDFMGEDLLSFGCKILVLGDPAQLPPVRGEGFFTRDEPDILLTENHRQAKDSAIISLAELIRGAKRPPVGVYGEGVEVVRRSSLDPAQVSEFVAGGGQLLLGRNASRIATNQRIRSLHHRASWAPEPGERVVCLNNNHPLGLLNGDQWDVVRSEIVNDDLGRMGLEIIQEGAGSLTVEAHSHFFQGRGKELQWWEKNDAEQFDYGYALTVHKAQGSQWEGVYVFDQSASFGSDWWKWLYTSVTRAEKTLKIIYD